MLNVNEHLLSVVLVSTIRLTTPSYSVVPSAFHVLQVPMIEYGTVLLQRRVIHIVICNCVRDSVCVVAQQFWNEL